MKLKDRLLRQKKALTCLAAIGVILVVASVWSAQATRPGTHGDAGPQSIAMADFGMGGMAIKVIGSVAVLIGILYFGMHVMRSFSGKANAGGLRSDAISVLQKRHIAPKKAIYIVKVGDRTMVIGVTDSQISHLADLSQDELQNIKADASEQSKDFKKHLLGFAFGMRDKA
jgi:flagellar biosynthetic protein FliO